MNSAPLISDNESNKTRKLLIFAFTGIILLIILSTGIGFSHLNAVQHDINHIIETQNTQIDLMHKMRSIARERIIKLQALVATHDNFQHDDIITEFHELGGIFLETRLELKKTDLTNEEQTLLKIQREIARKAVSSQYKVIELVEHGLNDEALNILVNDTVPMQNENMSLIDQFILYQNHQNQDLQKDTESKVHLAYLIIIALTTLSIILIIIVAFLVIRRISRMMKLLIQSNRDYKKVTEELSSAQVLLEHKVTDRTKELQQANQALKYIAGHDSLTDLPNRRLFTELLTQEINKADRNLYNIAVLYMDLDGFKTINDEHGHDIGDALLVNVSKRLKASLRKDDLIARLGGDEFAICYSNVKDIEDIKILCQIIVDKISQPMYLGKVQCQIGISIGVSLYPKHGKDYSTLLRIADSAMYQVKEQGKNNFAFGS